MGSFDQILPVRSSATELDGKHSWMEERWRISGEFEAAEGAPLERAVETVTNRIMTTKEVDNGAKATMVICSLLAGAAVFFLLCFEHVPVQKTRTVSTGLFSPDRQETYMDMGWKMKDVPLGVLLVGGAIAFGAALIYPIVGAVAVFLTESLRRWAYVGKATQLEAEERLIMGALWLVTLVVSLLIYPFLGIIHRVF